VALALHQRVDASCQREERLVDCGALGGARGARVGCQGALGAGEVDERQLGGVCEAGAADEDLRLVLATQSAHLAQC
jgi:hypothetical protein